MSIMPLAGQAHRGGPLLMLLPAELHEQIAYVLQEDKSAIRASCRYLRDVVDRMATRLEVRPWRDLPRNQLRNHMKQLPDGLLARCPNITRIDLSGCERVCRHCRCDYPEGCIKKPSFGVPRGRPTRCSDHDEPGMVDLVWGPVTVYRNRSHLQLPQRLCSNITDLMPLIALQRLQEIVCINTQVTDLAPLAGVAAMTALRSLNCSNTGVTDLSPLATLTSLQRLDCSGTSVTVLSPLSSLLSLQSLDCSCTEVDDLSPLKALSALHSLNCSQTSAADLAPLAELTALQNLDCNNIRRALIDLAPLAALTVLRSLDCSGTQVADLSPLAALTSLRSLNCSRTRVTDLSPLAALAAAFLRIIH